MGTRPIHCYRLRITFSSDRALGLLHYLACLLPQEAVAQRVLPFFRHSCEVGCFAGLWQVFHSCVS